MLHHHETIMFPLADIEVASFSDAEATVVGRLSQLPAITLHRRHWRMRSDDGRGVCFAVMLAVSFSVIAAGIVAVLQPLTITWGPREARLARTL